jgi:hypothetical protein
MLDPKIPPFQIMATPTIKDYFGSDSIVMDDPAAIATWLTDQNISATNPVLMIPYTSLTAAGLSLAAKFFNPEVIFTCLIKNVSLWTRNDTTETNSIELGAPRAGITTRNGQQKFSSNYDITVYGKVLTTSDIDPDDVA